MLVVEPAGRVTAIVQLDRENPWPGLDAYDESSHDFFSGRATEVDELHRRILDDPITILFGKSGLGKSSLLKAGVFPRLREKGLFPIFIRLQVRPDADALIEQVRLAVFKELRAQEVEHPASRAGETLWEYLHRTELEFWTRQNRLTRPVLVFDQFEELFTLGRAVPAEVDAFREDLSDLAENRIPADLVQRMEGRPYAEAGLDVQGMPYKIVLSLREDFLADLEEWRLSMPSLRRNRMRLLPMQPEQALQAVCNERTSHLVAEPLARTIVAFLSGTASRDARGAADRGGSTVEPALLSLFSRGVNEHRKRDGKPIFDEALLEGGKDTIVADFYRTSLADQPERVRRFVEEQLITEHGFRNSYSVDDALARGAVTAVELATLINRHLLRHEHHLGTDRVELTHDLLTRAVVDERDRRRREELGRRERRQRWKLAGIAGFFAIVCAGVAIAMWVARNNAEAERDRSRSRELAGIATVTMSADPELAVRLALEGFQRADTADAWSALLDAARYTWPSTFLDPKELQGDPTAVALSADGNRLAVLTAGGAITLWDMSSGRPQRTTSIGLENASSVVFSPDQKFLAVGGKESIDLFDATTGVRHKQLPQPSTPRGRQIAFTRDSQWLASSQPDGSLQLLDYRNEPMTPVLVPADEGAGAFGLLDRQRIMVVHTQYPMSAYWLKQEGTRWEKTPVDLSRCMNPQSVSPGAETYSASWKARTCIFPTTGAGRIEESDRAGSDPTADIIWSQAGRAFAEVLVSEDLIVGRNENGFREEKWESHIKGAHTANANDKSQLIAVSELATRAVVIDEHERVRVYQLADNKPFLSLIDRNAVALAPDGSWMAVARRPPGEPAVIDVTELNRAAPSTFPVRARIPLSAFPEAVFATESSIIVALRTDPPSSISFDAVTGTRRAGTHVGNVVPLGREGELLFVRPPEGPPRVVKTRDGSVLAPWEQSLPGTGPLIVTWSPNKAALAALRAGPANVPRTNALVYVIRGDTLVLSGRALDLPGYPSSWQPVDDATAIVEETSRQTWRLRGLDPAQLQPPAATKGELQESPLGRFELQESIDGKALPTFEVVRRANQSVLGPFRTLQPTPHYRFSSDDRWLANWSTTEIQMVDLEKGEIAFGLNVRGVSDVTFAGQSTILRVNVGARAAMLLPLDRALTERFVKWLVPDELTPRQRCDYGFGGKGCGKDGITPRSQLAHPEGSDKK